MTGFDFGGMSGSIERRARAAHEAGYLDRPDHETMMCPCGHHGSPEAIIRYSEWSVSDTDRDMFVCPECGDA
jgi:hypothetical protein